MKKQCPNPDCKSLHFSKDGSFMRKSDSRKIQRFKCRVCKKRFSNATFRLEKNQNKRQINHLVFQLLSSGLSMRRIAKVVNIDKKTVQRKVDYLALKARIKQRDLLKKLHKTVTELQFDDLITSEHTKLKPVSISLAVDKSTRLILGAKPSQIPAFGHLASLSKKKYGYRKSEHKKALNSLFSEIHQCVQSGASVESDEHKNYPDFVRRYLPLSRYKQYKGGRGCVVGQGELKKLTRDPLFAINMTCAMLRDNLKRLARRTWCTTKSIKMLKKHLDIYIWYHNYEYLKFKAPLRSVSY